MRFRLYAIATIGTLASVTGGGSGCRQREGLAQAESRPPSAATTVDIVSPESTAARAQARVDSLERALKRLTDSATAAAKQRTEDSLALVKQRIEDSLRLVKKQNEDAVRAAKARLEDSLLTERQRPRSHLLVETTGMNIRPGSFSEYGFVLDSAGTCSVEGRIEALSGGRKDGQVLVMTEDNFVNWKNNPQGVGGGLFSSPYQTVTTLEFSVLSAGRFYLVISNRISMLSSKTVKGSASVTCTGGVQPRAIER